MMPLLLVAQIGLHAAGFRADIFKVAAYAYVAIFGGWFGQNARERQCLNALAPSEQPYDKNGKDAPATSSAG